MTVTVVRETKISKLNSWEWQVFCDSFENLPKAFVESIILISIDNRWKCFTVHRWEQPNREKSNGTDFALSFSSQRPNWCLPCYGNSWKYQSLMMFEWNFNVPGIHDERIARTYRLGTRPAFVVGNVQRRKISHGGNFAHKRCFIWWYFGRIDWTLIEASNQWTHICAWPQHWKLQMGSKATFSTWLAERWFDEHRSPWRETLFGWKRNCDLFWCLQWKYR